MTLREQVRGRWRQALLVWGVCVAAGAVAAWLAPRKYECQVLLRSGRVDGQPVEDPAVLIQVMQSDEFLQELAGVLGEPAAAADQQVDRLRVRERVGATLVTVRGATAEEARRVAEACVRVVVGRHARLQVSHRRSMEDYFTAIEREEKELIARQAALDGQIRKIGHASPGVTAPLIARLVAVEDQIVKVRLDAAEQRARLARLMEPATTVIAPTAPRRSARTRPSFVLLSSSVAGLLLALAWTFTVELHW